MGHQQGIHRRYHKQGDRDKLANSVNILDRLVAARGDNSKATARLKAQILDDLNSFLRFNINDPRLRFVSITRVDLRKDYSQALVHWDTFDCEKRQDAEVAMGRVAGKLRALLARRLKIKSVPELLIKYDGQFVDEKRISELLSSPGP